MGLKYSKRNSVFGSLRNLHSVGNSRDSENAFNGSRSLELFLSHFSPYSDETPERNASLERDFLCSILLKRFPRFSKNNVEEIVQCLDFVLVAPDGIVYEAGSFAKSGFYVFHGEIGLFDGKKHVRTLHEGEIFGITDAFQKDYVAQSNNYLYTLDAKGLNNVSSQSGIVLIRLNAKDFDNFKNNKKNLAAKRIILDTLETSLRCTNFKFLYSFPIFRSMFSFNEDESKLSKSPRKLDRNSAKINTIGIGKIRQLLRFERLTAGTLLTKENALVNLSYILISGKAALTYTDKNGLPVKLKVFSPKNGSHDIFLGVLSAIAGEKCLVNTIVLEPSVAFVFEKHELKALFHFLPDQFSLYRARASRLKHMENLAKESLVLKNMGKEKRTLLNSLIEGRIYKSGRVILKAGKKNEKERVYFIVSGECTVVIEKKMQGKRSILKRVPSRISRNQNIRKLIAGEYFGELSVLSGLPCTATVYVSKRCKKAKILFIEKETFVNLVCKKQYCLAEFYLRAFGKEIPVKYLLYSRALEETLINHTKEEYSDENVLFYQAVQSLQHLNNTAKLFIKEEMCSLTKVEYKTILQGHGLSKQEADEIIMKRLKLKCKHIWENFVAPGSPHEVNLPYIERKEVEENLNKENFIDLFEQSSRSILVLLETDVLTRFRRSENFENELENLNIYEYIDEEEKRELMKTVF
eukprot:snap_masked-scaffold_22-processed-gene-4.17-mRNA-1 protein AED:1.00 eAED:1.00 QI:0/-1/0/0/-1/1/1/0/693